MSEVTGQYWWEPFAKHTFSTMKPKVSAKHTHKAAVQKRGGENCAREYRRIKSWVSLWDKRWCCKLWSAV